MSDFCGFDAASDDLKGDVVSGDDAKAAEARHADDGIKLPGGEGAAELLLEKEFLIKITHRCIQLAV